MLDSAALVTSGGRSLTDLTCSERFRWWALLGSVSGALEKFSRCCILVGWADGGSMRRNC